MRFSILLFVLSMALSQSTAAFGDAPKTGKSAAASALDVPAKHVVVATDKGKLLVLIDLYPFAAQLKAKSAAEANAIAEATATRYVQQHAAAKEHANLPEATVMLVSVKNMDEYNRPNYGGMLRHGTLTFKRGAKNEMRLVENKIDFKNLP